MSASENEQEVLTVAEVQRILRVSRQTVVEMIGRKEIEGFRVGKLWRVTRRSIEALKRGERPQPPASEQG